MGGNVFRPRPTSGKRERLCFGHGRKLEIAEKPPVAHKRNAELPNFRSSLVSETQNRSISVLPTPWKVRIAHFLRFQPLGKAELPIFCVSNPLEKQNYPFSAFPTPWKSKNTHFLRFQPLGKAKSLIFCISNPLESQKCPENRLSSTDDGRKTVKTGFHPRVASEKQQILGFIHG